MTIHEILEKEGINENAVLREHALFVALSKKAFYESECRRFELKFGLSFDSAMKRHLGQTNKEDFQVSDDINEWEYAVKALAWWNARIEEVRLVA